MSKVNRPFPIFLSANCLLDSPISVPLYSSAGYQYYKVPVQHGSTVDEDGGVPHKCHQVGLQAVCSGLQGCTYVNTAECLVTPLSTDCGNPM